MEEKDIREEEINEENTEITEETETQDTKEVTVIEREPMTEEECVRRQAKETDYMVSLLLDNLVHTIVNNLKDNGKLFFVYQSSRLQEMMDMLFSYN